MGWLGELAPEAARCIRIDIYLRLQHRLEEGWDVIAMFGRHERNSTNPRANRHMDQIVENRLGAVKGDQKALKRVHETRGKGFGEIDDTKN
jgi:hypothetical protein